MAADSSTRGGCLGCATVIALLVGLLVGLMVVVAPTTVGLTMRAYAERTLSNLGIETEDKGEPSYAEKTVTDGVEQYSRGLLDEGCQAVYDTLLDGVVAMEEEIAVIETNAEDVSTAYKAMMCDHPELFWLDGSFTYTYSSLLDAVTVEPGYEISVSEIVPTRAAIEAEADAILASVGEGASEYDIARMAYEHIASTTNYNAAAEHNQTIQSVFLNHASVCAGYARAYQYLLHRAGLFCAYVEGSIGSRGEDHAWNLVKIDGQYAYVDPTWADPTYMGEDPGVAIDGVIYDYLCLTSNEIARDDHLFAREEDWPVCDATDLDYYRRQGLFFDAYDQQGLAEAFWREVEAQGNKVAFKFGSDEAYVQAKSELEGGSFLREELLELAATRGGDSIRYSYSVSDPLRIIKLYW